MIILIPHGCKIAGPWPRGVVRSMWGPFGKHFKSNVQQRATSEPYLYLNQWNIINETRLSLRAIFWVLAVLVVGCLRFWWGLLAVQVAGCLLIRWLAACYSGGGCLLSWWLAGCCYWWAGSCPWSCHQLASVHRPPRESVFLPVPGYSSTLSRRSVVLVDEDGIPVFGLEVDTA